MKAKDLPYRNKNLKRDLLKVLATCLTLGGMPVVIVAFDYFHNVRHIF